MGKEIDQSIQIKIISLNGKDVLELFSQGNELTLCYGHTHWHIDDYNDNFRLENIYESAINSVFDVLNGEIVSYGAFYNEEVLGGGSRHGNETSLIEESRKTFLNANLIKISRWNEEEKTIQL